MASHSENTVPAPEDHKTLISHFEHMASSYEKSTRGVTRNVATHFLSTLTPPISASSIIHDNACGPGIVTFEILESLHAANKPPPAHVIATDITPGMIQAMQAKLEAKTVPGADGVKIEAHVRDSQDLRPIADATFTHSITCFGIFACPDAAKAAREIYRTLKPGGVAAVTTWKYAATMDIIQRVSRKVRPGQAEWNPISKDWNEEWKLKEVLREGGFEEGGIEVTGFDQRGFVEEGKKDVTEGIVEAFQSGFFDLAKKGWSEEEKGKWDDTIREVLTEDEKRMGVEMNAWVGVARK
ncbi:MAG: hypothetical protein Q9160_002162 [Pyrenula sp. 1 TL-2023]